MRLLYLLALGLVLTAVGAPTAAANCHASPGVSICGGPFGPLPPIGPVNVPGSSIVTGLLPAVLCPPAAGCLPMQLVLAAENIVCGFHVVCVG